MRDELASCERDPALPFIMRYVAGDCRVLESGCGLSRWVKYLSDKGVDIVGLEYLRETIVDVRSVWPELQLVQADAANCPFEDNSLDVVLSLGVVEHFLDGPSRLLSEIYRILRPKGVAVVSVPCMNKIRQVKRSLWLNEIARLPEAAYGSLVKGKSMTLNRTKEGYKHWVDPAYGEFQEYRLTDQEFLSETRGAGFEVLEHHPIGMIDGMYFELNPLGLLVKYANCKFEAKPFVWAMNERLSRTPFFHSHMQIVIAEKPAGAD